jgi:hypothetical protein
MTVDSQIHFSPALVVCRREPEWAEHEVGSVFHSEYPDQGPSRIWLVRNVAESIRQELANLQSSVVKIEPGPMWHYRNRMPYVLLYPYTYNFDFRQTGVTYGAAYQSDSGFGPVWFRPHFGEGGFLELVKIDRRLVPRFSRDKPDFSPRSEVHARSTQ